MKYYFLKRNTTGNKRVIDFNMFINLLLLLSISLLIFYWIINSFFYHLHLFLSSFYSNILLFSIVVILIVLRFIFNKPELYVQVKEDSFLIKYLFPIPSREIKFTDIIKVIIDESKKISVIELEDEFYHIEPIPLDVLKRILITKNIHFSDTN
jgi:hypothetical protein